jgi:hypothetical protein
MVKKSVKSDLEIVTFNCNGLANQTKLKRILLKASEIVNKGGIVFLQETHVVDTGYININFFQTVFVRTRLV